MCLCACVCEGHDPACVCGISSRCSHSPRAVNCPALFLLSPLRSVALLFSRFKPVTFEQLLLHASLQRNLSSRSRKGHKPQVLLPFDFSFLTQALSFSSNSMGKADKGADRTACPKGSPTQDQHALHIPPVTLACVRTAPDRHLLPSVTGSCPD